MSIARLTVLLSVIAAIVPSAALANPADLFGFGARGPALGNAMVAYDDPSSAAYYNLATAAHAQKIELAFGYMYAFLPLEISGRSARVMEAHGTYAGLTIPFAVSSDVRLALTTGFQLPDPWVARVQLLPPTEPQFVLWDNRPHRTTFNAGIALEWGALSLGVGATLLADAGGPGVDFDARAAPGRVIAEAGVDARLPLRAAPIVGLVVRPLEGLTIGARYSGEVALDLRLPVRVGTAVPGTDIGGTISIDVGGTDYFTPHELSIGASYTWEDLTVALELGYQNWAHVPRVGSDVGVQIDIGIPVPTMPLVVPPPAFRDVFMPRVGVEYRFDLGREDTLALRAGWWFAPSPVPDQPGLTSYTDADRHAVTLGAGVRLPRALPFPVSIDMALQAQILSTRLFAKDPAIAPIGTYSAGGSVWMGTIGVKAEL